MPIGRLDLPGHAGKTAEEAVALLAAPECPSGVVDVILDPTQCALQIHESIGHPTELDRVLGIEANYAGTTNVSLLPGPWTPEALIEDTKDGIFLSVNKSWSIDDRRLDFQFGTEAAWEIKNGRLGRLLKNPTYGGRTPELWSSCDGIGSDWELWGVPNCGKGQPSQTMGVSHGAPTVRFRKVKVGVAR